MEPKNANILDATDINNGYSSSGTKFQKEFSFVHPFKMISDFIVKTSDSTSDEFNWKIWARFDEISSISYSPNGNEINSKIGWKRLRFENHLSNSW